MLARPRAEMTPEQLVRARARDRRHHEKNREKRLEAGRQRREKNRGKYPGKFEEYDRQRREAPERRAKQLVHDALRRDQKRGFKSLRVIDWEQVAQLIEAGQCEATSVSFELGPPSRGRTRNFLSPSIDKINSKKPYQPNRGGRNWKLVTTAFNIAHSELSDPEFLDIVARPRLAADGANPFPLDTPAGDACHKLGKAIRKRSRRVLMILTINPIQQRSKPS
jgi:hypothetical protein